MNTFPTFDKTKVKPVKFSDALKRLTFTDGLEFETNPSDGDVVYFTSPLGLDDDMLFMVEVRVEDAPQFLVQVNILDSNLGKLFEDMDEAIAWGKEQAEAKDLAQLIIASRPTPEQVAKRLEGFFERAANGEKIEGLTFDTVSDEEVEELLQQQADKYKPKTKH